MLDVIVDLDQTIYPFVNVLEAYCIERHINYDFDMTKYDFFSPGWSRRRFVDVCSKAVKDGVLYQEGIYPESLDFMNNLKSMGCKIHIVTHREFVSTQVSKLATLNWLSDYEIPYDSLVLTGDKGSVKADMAIDDNPKYCQDMINAGTDAWVLAHPYNTESKLNKVESLQGFANIVELQIIAKNLVA